MKISAKIRNALIVLAISALVILSAGLTACASNVFGGGDKFDKLTTAESVYGFSAASAGILISAMNGGEASVLTSSARLAEPSSAEGILPDDGAVTDPSADAELSELDGYMALVDSLLSDGVFSSDVSASDRAEYDNKMTITYTDISGNRLQYVMYYNEILVDFDDDDWDEFEEEYAIDGVMVIDGIDYAIRGERSYEEDGEETESETEFRVTLGNDTYMYVEQKYEFEYEHGKTEVEQEYSYSVRSGGRVIERSTFSYEEEDGETELEMVTYRDGVNSRFMFKREKYRGKEAIRIRVGTGRDTKNYIVSITENADGTVSYDYVEYNNGRY